jgi:hypothetical protein
MTQLLEEKNVHLSNFTDFEHPMLKGLRPNARQLVERGIHDVVVGDAEGDRRARMADAATPVRATHRFGISSDP